MSAVVQQQPATRWGSSPYSRMSSVEELDSSLTLLSRHIVLAKNLPMTPPGTPSAVPGVEEMNSFEYGSPVCTPIQKIPPNTPVTPFCRPLNIVTDGRADSFDLRSSGNNGTLQAPNVAAIDNKIEQAMDLVKTHLTFAVREEVEILRQTISDLEMKVAALESENQLLRQYAPSEIVANLSSLVQKQKETNAPPQPIVASLPILPPPNVPAGFCSSSFATTLNNVVADVRQEMALATGTAKEPGHL